MLGCSCQTGLALIDGEQIKVGLISCLHQLLNLLLLCVEPLHSSLKLGFGLHHIHCCEGQRTEAVLLQTSGLVHQSVAKLRPECTRTGDALRFAAANQQLNVAQSSDGAPESSW